MSQHPMKIGRWWIATVLLLGCKSDKEKCLASSMEENLPICAKVCDTDDADACHQAAYINTMYMHVKEANALYKKACKLGRKESCDYVR